MQPYVDLLRAFLRLRICRIHECVRSQICNFSKTPGMGSSGSFRAEPVARRPNTEDPTQRSNPPRRHRGQAAARLGLSWPRSPPPSGGSHPPTAGLDPAANAILEVSQKLTPSHRHVFFRLANVSRHGDPRHSACCR